MTALALIIGTAAGVGGASLWWRRQLDVVRDSHQLHEAASHVRYDAALRAARHIDRWIDDPRHGARVLSRAARYRRAREHRMTMGPLP